MRTLVMLWLALGACVPATAPDPVEPQPAVRSWDVPKGRAQPIVQVINRLLQKNNGPVGRALEGPDGSVVAIAPPSVLEGLDGLVQRAVSGPPTAPDVTNIEMRYWLVEATPGPSDRPAELGEIGPALDAIEQADGPQRFTVVHTQSLRSMSGGGNARLSTGQGLGVRQSAQRTPGTDQIVASVSIEVPSVDSRQPDADVSTQLALNSGDLAVVSQLGGAPTEAGPTHRYLVVRATLLP